MTPFYGVYLLKKLDDTDVWGDIYLGVKSYWLALSMLSVKYANLQSTSIILTRTFRETGCTLTLLIFFNMMLSVIMQTLSLNYKDKETENVIQYSTEPKANLLL